MSIGSISGTGKAATPSLVDNAHESNMYAQALQGSGQGMGESSVRASAASAGNGTSAPGDVILQSFTQSHSIDAVHPQGLSSGERINGRAFGVGGLNITETPGSALQEALENVHAKTQAYENKQGEGIDGGEYGAVNSERLAMQPNMTSLGAPAAKEKSLNETVDGQIDRYMGMMREGYEYYIFTSMTIDVGKGISQTANGLTKG